MAKILGIHCCLYFELIYILLFISHFHLSISINNKIKLVDIKQLSSKKGYYAILEDGIYIFSPDLINYKKIYKFNQEQKVLGGNTKIIFDEFKSRDIDYYAFLIRNCLYIYNTKDKKMNFQKINYELNLEPLNMRINGSNLDIMFVKKVPLNTKIILISYFFDEKSGTEYIYQEKELYSLKESLLKDIFNCQIDKLNHLIKCFSYNNNLTIIELNLSKDYKKIKMN